MRATAKILDWLRFFWVALFSLALLLNLDQFLFSAGIGPAPKYWSIGIFLCTALIFLPGLRPKVLLRNPLLWWSLGYIFFSLVWVGRADDLQGAVYGMSMVVVTCIYIWIGLLAYSRMQDAHKLWRAVIWLALIGGVSSIWYEYFYPASIFSSAGMGISGRAAGFYLNPNIAAQALVMIFACMMRFETRGGLLLATLIVLIGLFPTFSRGGFIVWGVLVGLAVWAGKMSRWIALASVAGVAVIGMAGEWVFHELSALIDPGNQNVLSRLAWILGAGGGGDYSALEREGLVWFALDKFMQAPFLGHGLGYMWVWDYQVGSHNLMLRHLVEYGALGVLIFPSFVYCGLRSGWSHLGWRWSLSMAMVVFILSFFSHNILENGSFMLPWLAICLMPTAESLKKI